MKLCSICDKKIEGSWCKNCHRFVKTYELTDGIHLNESHNPENDKDCTYHTDSTGTTRGQSGTSAARTTYSQTQKSSETTRKKSKAGKIVLIVVIVYFVLMAVSMIISAVKQISNSVVDEFTLLLQEETEWNPSSLKETPELDSSYLEEAPELDSEVDALLAEMNNKLAALNTLKPVDSYKEDDDEYSYVISYYEPEEIEQLGVPCTDEHFAMDLTEFEEWLKENWSASYTLEVYTDAYNNYLYEDDYYVMLSFSTYYDYYLNEDLSVSVSCDTATKQLHTITFNIARGTDYTELYYAALQRLDSKVTVSANEIEKTLASFAGTENYELLYSSETISVVYEETENDVVLRYYPLEEY